MLMCCCTAGGVAFETKFGWVLPVKTNHVTFSAAASHHVATISIVTTYYTNFGKLKNALELSQTTHQKNVQLFVTLPRITRGAKMADILYPYLGTRK